MQADKRARVYGIFDHKSGARSLAWDEYKLCGILGEGSFE